MRRLIPYTHIVTNYFRRSNVPAPPTPPQTQHPLKARRGRAVSTGEPEAEDTARANDLKRRRRELEALERDEEERIRTKRARLGAKAKKVLPAPKIPDKKALAAPKTAAGPPPVQRKDVDGTRHVVRLLPSRKPCPSPSIPQINSKVAPRGRAQAKPPPPEDELADPTLSELEELDDPDASDDDELPELEDVPDPVLFDDDDDAVPEEDDDTNDDQVVFDDELTPELFRQTIRELQAARKRPNAIRYSLLSTACSACSPCM